MAAMRISSLLAAVAWLAVSGASVPAALAQAAQTQAVQADFTQALAAYDGGDLRAAFEEWRALAEAGDAEAQVALAGLYSAGEGTRADPVAALRWYRAAAEQGDAIAQQNLGDLLSRGLGAARDLVSAYVWLSLAADQGRGWATRRRDELSPQLTSEQRAEAEVRLVARRRSL